MLGSDIVRSGCLVLLALLSWADQPSMLLLYAVVGVYGAATGVFGPAFDAIIPESVPAQELTKANALDQLNRPIGLRMLGPRGAGRCDRPRGHRRSVPARCRILLVSAAMLLALPRTSRARPSTTVMGVPA